MLEVHENYVNNEINQAWMQARRRARQTLVLDYLIGQNGHSALLDFNEVSHRLNLKTAIYRGVQNIPLDKIVGSVGRYQDFTRAFLPVDDGLRRRWQKIASLYLNPTSNGAPPIEAYKVGDAYFVKDGNHRVSVANQLEMVDIEAYVWEYPEPVDGLPDNADLDTLLIEAERRDFLDKTRLDELRPNHKIRLTAPGGYPAMLRQIVHYQHVLAKIDEQEVPYEKAVTAWYDMVYETTVRRIKESGVMDLFPERTVADFFVWVKAHQEQLKERYHKPVLIQEAAEDIKKQKRTVLPTRTWYTVLRWLVQRLV